MGKLNRLHQITGWLVFVVAAVVYLLSAERTGSLWDCGEFVLGAYKMQVVHPPGAPLFLLIGRMFAIFGGGLGVEDVSNPANIAFAVNVSSGICSAFAAAFVAWITIRLSLVSLFGRDERAERTTGQDIAVAAAGLVAGLATAFSTSVWFSAVEGEVYAMSLFFTCLTAWAMIKWYCKPDTPEADRWLLFALFASGLSIGVHLLSILTIPAMAIFYYYKKKANPNIGGLVLSLIAGVGIIIFIQSNIIVGIPEVWQSFEIPLVNSMGLGVHSGIIPTLLLFGGVGAAVIYAAEKLKNGEEIGLGLKLGIFIPGLLMLVMSGGSFILLLVFIALLGLLVFKGMKKEYAYAIQQGAMGFLLMIVAFSTVGVVVLRAEAKTPVNMNNPDNVTSLLPYLNREQYGERSLIYGQTFTSRVVDTEVEPRRGLVDGEYEENVTQKITPVYDKKMLFSRMYDNTQGRVGLYKQWMGLDPSAELPRGRPNFVDNIKFFVNYQLGWMYWRYFMWNFSGRQNGEQGYYSWDDSSGNWITGIKFLDEARLGNLDELPEKAKNDPARNTYFLLPFIFGLIGLFWHASRNPKEFIGLLALFVITGIGIIVYTNQPPNEPRERDYVLVGSFFTFCIWMGMAVPALYQMITERMEKGKDTRSSGVPIAGVLAAVVLIAPVLMGTQNWDDHSRAEHAGARDYASNFLNSVDENAIIFTYGDNDTYPLWYAQEVEGIRPDVRVVNLSLIAVDWYIDLLRYKMNDSPPINLTIPQEKIRGRLRNQIPYFNQANPEGDIAKDRPAPLDQFINMLGTDNPVPLRGGSSLMAQYNTRNVFVNVNPNQLGQAPWLVPEGEQAQQRIPIRINGSRILKDELAILDIINSNFYERPIYWAVTCQRSKLMGLEPFLELEGLALKLTATRNDNEDQYGIIGSGGINENKTFEIVMNDWRWGNFDQVDTHISSSYAPAVQSMQIVILRTMETLAAKGNIEDALRLGDEYFEAFPDKNFPFFYQTYLMLQPYMRAGEMDRALPVIEQLATNVADQLDFFNSLDPETRALSYRQEDVQAEAIARGLIQNARIRGSDEVRAAVERILGNYLYLVPDQQPVNPG